MRVMLGAGIGVVFALLFLLNPIIHYLTGPVAPLLGGMIGSRVARVKQHESVRMGLVLAGLNTLGLVAVGLAVWSLFGEVLRDVPPILAGAVALVAGLYSATLSVLGAVLGARGRTA